MVIHEAIPICTDTYKANCTYSGDTNYLDPLQESPRPRTSIANWTMDISASMQSIPNGDIHRGLYKRKVISLNQSLTSTL